MGEMGRGKRMRSEPKFKLVSYIEGSVLTFLGDQKINDDSEMR